MNLQSAPPGSKTAKCRVCEHRLADGEDVLHERFMDLPYGHRDVFWHVVCVQALIDGLPANATLRRHRNEKALVAIKELILETGDVFA